MVKSKRNGNEAVGSQRALLNEMNKIVAEELGTKVVGNGSFKSGRLETPKRTKRSAEQILKDMGVKDKAPKVAKPKKVVNPLFARDNTEALDDFVDSTLKSIKGLEMVEVKVNNRKQPTEKTLRYHGRMCCWLPPRSNMLFGVYLFPVSGKKEILKITDEQGMKNLLGRVEEICEAIDSMPAKEPKAKKAVKAGKAVKGGLKIRPLEDVLAQFDNLKNGKAMKVPAGYTPKSTELVEAIEEHGGKFDWENRLICRA